MQDLRLLVLLVLILFLGVQRLSLYFKSKQNQECFFFQSRCACGYLGVNSAAVISDCNQHSVLSQRSALKPREHVTNTPREDYGHLIQYRTGHGYWRILCLEKEAGDGGSV